MLRKFFLLLLLSLTAFDAFASRAPFFNRETVARFEALEDSINNGEITVKLAYSFTANGKSSGDTQALSESIPAGAYITKVWAFVSEDVVSTDSNTIALGCETSNDLFAANNFADDSVNTAAAGAVTSPANGVYTSDGCTPTMTIGSGDSGISAGEIIWHIEYIMPEEQ